MAKKPKSVKACVPEIRSRRVPNPYGPGQTEERVLWCKTHEERMGGQVATANSTGHRYAQYSVEKEWTKHIRKVKRKPIVTKRKG